MGPYQNNFYDLSICQLRPLKPEEGSEVAAELSKIDPWKRMNFSSQSLENYFTKPDGSLFRFGVCLDDLLIGIVAIRYPWLRGPYLEFLGLSPSGQNRGVGKQILVWMEQEAKAAGQRNLWVAVSDFNIAAFEFYLAFGFAKAGDLEGLVADGFNEILLRKQIV